MMNLIISNSINVYAANDYDDLGYLEENYDVSVDVTAQWENHYNAELTIKNIGQETIENWELSFNLMADIENVWCAKIVKSEDDSYLVKNDKWNQDIAPGQEVKFGITVIYKDDLDYPNNFNMTKVCKNVDKKEYSVEKIINSQWDDGVSGVIRIRNLSGKVIEDWKLCFNSDLKFNDLCNAIVDNNNDNEFYLNNNYYNSNIEPDGYVDIGFNATYSGDYKLDDFELYSVETYMEDTRDSDSDGLYDCLEEKYNTNIDERDSDSDGLSDYFEIVVCNTDPLKNDEDGNAIIDGNDDYDGDGLINSAEETYGTEPYDDDTDIDRLGDYEEIYIYNTNPVEEDSDGDGLSDGFEINYNLDPLDAKSNNDEKNNEWLLQSIKEDFEERPYEYIEVALNVPGDIEECVDISSVKEDLCGIDSDKIININSDVNGKMYLKIKFYEESLVNNVKIFKYEDNDWKELPLEIQGLIVSFETMGDGYFAVLTENEKAVKNTIYKKVKLSKNTVVNDKEKKLKSQLKKQSKKDIGEKKQKLKKYTSDEAVDIILKNDDFVDEASTDYKINKALIQALLFRELTCYDARDDVADSMVIEYFVYKERLEAYMKAPWWKQLIMGSPTPSYPIRDDCSTGIGQIFARTAIRSINYNSGKGSKLNTENWKHRKTVWYNLHNDNEYNVYTIAKILNMESAGMKDMNLNNPKSKQAKLLLSRYNLSGRKKVATYGKLCYKYYKYFKEYNN